MSVDLPYTQAAWVICVFLVLLTIASDLLPYVERAHERYCAMRIRLAELEWGLEDDDGDDPDPAEAPVEEAAEVVDLSARRAA